MVVSTDRPQSGTEARASFAGFPLRPATLRALRTMGIEQPTPIQDAALPVLLEGRDIIGQARTGSGKTLAFSLPAIQSVDRDLRRIQVLVLVPTRELAVQVGSVIEEASAGQGISTTLVFGGRGINPQIAAIRRGAQVVVGTPGRILDLIRQDALNLSSLRMLVLDEADEMLDRGFAPDVERIIARTPRNRQTALFSATLPEWVQETANRHLANPVLVKVDPRPEDVAEIDHVAFDLGRVEKIDALTELLDVRGDGQIIVFGRTKHGVKKLARKLEQQGYPVAALQGNMSQNARDRVMESFRAGSTQILLATNVAARGLDITTVEQVINFDLPESSELLTHRVGRTGRMGRYGQAITLLNQEDHSKWRQLERGVGKRIPRVNWPGAKAVVNGDISRAPAAQPVRSQPVATPERPAQEATASGRYQITCQSCGKPDAVPFQPDPSRPIYCGACHREQRSYRAARAGRH